MTIKLVNEDMTRNNLNQRRHEDGKNVRTKHKKKNRFDRFDLRGSEK